MSATDIQPNTAQKLKDEYEEAIENAMNNPVITRITRFVPSTEGIEFDLEEFKRRVRIFAPEMREVTQKMFGDSDHALLGVFEEQFKS